MLDKRDIHNSCQVRGLYPVGTTPPPISPSILHENHLGSCYNAASNSAHWRGDDVFPPSSPDTLQAADPHMSGPQPFFALGTCFVQETFFQGPGSRRMVSG